MSMNTANRVTVFRIFLIPIFVIFALQVPQGGWYRYYAVICFGLMGCLDLLDGFLARRFHEETKLGTVLDPIADKMLMNTAFIMFALQPQTWGAFPRPMAVLAVLVVSRDIYMLIGFLILLHVKGQAKTRPNTLGKITTHLQFLTASATLLGTWYDNNPYILVPLYIATGLTTIVSGIIYTFTGLRHLNAETPASS